MLIFSPLSWSITCYNDKVRREVLGMPAGIVADYVRLTDAMTLHGADLRMPHARAMGAGLFELRLARKRLKDVQHG